MARKFVLIDQSIASIAGHHFEYAVHVLEAAQRAGFDPYLATHVRFAKSPHKAPRKTFALYHHGFWAAQGAPRFASVEWMIARFTEWRFRYRLAYNYSMVGLLWQVRDRFGEFLLRQPMDRSHLVSLATLIPLALLLKLLRFLVLLAMLPVMLLVFLGRSAVRLLKAGGFPESYVRSLLADAADLRRFQAHVWSRRNQFLNWWQQYRSLQGFRADTERLLRETGAGPGDVMFVPTVSAIELMGLSELLRRNPAGTGPSWHMLFRRDIYTGRESDYAAQDGALNDLRQVMLTSQAKLAGHDVRFYTDTEELTRQHNRLGAFPFATVAIPHTHRPAPAKSDCPLTVLYIGDARSEKGYHLIPSLVENVWQDYVETGRVRFRLQSNFNIPQGEPRAVIARQHLEHLAARKPGAIELRKDPMTSEQYKEFLLSGDINLLLYDASNYYARSSGILVESLSAGMPVVVPAGSWLARQFLDEVHDYQCGLRRRLKIFRSCTLSELRWKTHGGADNNPAAGGKFAAGHEAKVFTWVEPDPSVTHMLLELRLGGAQEALVFVDQLDSKGNSLAPVVPFLAERDKSDRAVALMPVQPGCCRIWLAAGSARTGMSVSVEALRLDLLVRLPGQSEPAVSAVGVIAQRETDLASCFRELVEHYEHYAATARDFSIAWQQYHNGDTLVAELALPKGGGA